MTFEVGDRVRYVNRTLSGCSTAVGCEGTVVDVRDTDTSGRGIHVRFDTHCWFDNNNTVSWVFGEWKWELVSSNLTPEQRIIRKCQNLTQRFNNKQLKTKSKPLPFPKEVKYV